MRGTLQSRGTERSEAATRVGRTGLGLNVILILDEYPGDETRLIAGTASECEAVTWETPGRVGARSRLASRIQSLSDTQLRWQRKGGVIDGA